MTAHAVQGDQARCLAAGMDAYIAKPIQPDELTEMVEGIAGSVSLRNTSATKSAAVLELAEALDHVEGDEQLLADLAGVFLKDYPAQMKEIRRAINQQDLAGIERAAHSLKGAVANFGARRTFNVAFELEKASRGGDLAECPV